LLNAEDDFVVPPTLNINAGESLYRTYLNGELLEVREKNNYRWFHFGGDVVQAAIDTLNRENILLPVPQSMLIFLLWQKPPLNVLNLGMGAGAIENALEKFPDILITSVEAESQIIDMAKRYFLSSENPNIFHQNAEAFIQSTTDKYDIILCDIFYKQQSPDCIYSSGYYHDLDDKLNQSGTVLINLFPESKENLLRIMTASRQYFDHVALIEFDDYQNIVLILSKDVLPNKEQLILLNNIPGKLTETSFEEHINNIHFVP
jgi:spermidine synthase